MRRLRCRVPAFGGIVAGCLLFLTLTSVLALRRASQDVDDCLAAASRDAYGLLDAQLGLLLRHEADAVVRLLEHDPSPTFSELKAVADAVGVDEVYVLGRSGEVIASSLPQATAALKGVDLRGDSACAPFFELFTNRKGFVGQKFRSSIVVPGCLVKYVGMHLPRQGAVLLLGYSFDRFDREFERLFQPIFDQVDLGKNAFYVLADTTSGEILWTQPNRLETAVGTLDDLCSRRGCPEWLLPFSPFFGQRYRSEPINRRSRRHLLPYAIQPVWVVYRQPVENLGWMTLALLIFCTIYRVAEVRVRRARAKVEELRQSELATAHDIQMSEMRLSPVNSRQYAVSALVEPAREVGGDFFDYYPLSDGRFVITVADVSDKGIPAAIFMMKSRLILRTKIASAGNLAAAVAAANVQLQSNNSGKMFVTAFVGVFDPQTGHLTYVSAGHNPPILRHADGSVEWVRGGRSLVLGMRPSVAYHEESLALLPGDRLLLYTDGVTEAKDERGRFYAEARLEAAVRASDEDLVASVKADVAAFVGGNEQSDDITLLEFRLLDVDADHFGVLKGGVAVK